MKGRVKWWWPELENWTALLASSALLPVPLRLALLRRRGHVIGQASRLSQGTIVTGHRLLMGDEVFVNRGCWLEADDAITLGDRVQLGSGVHIITRSHSLGGASERAGEMTEAPVRVGAGTWIGSGAIVQPGVTIGASCVVLAGAVVTKDVPANTVVGGVPAKPVREMLT